MIHCVDFILKIHFDKGFVSPLGLICLLMFSFFANRSDVLGQFIPMVGVDWSHTGVTHLFSVI